MTSFLERLIDLEAKATPGPWLRDGVLSDAWRVILSPERGPYIAAFATGEGQEHDGEANAEIARLLRNAVPEVKALIEAVQMDITCVSPRAAYDDQDFRVYRGDVLCESCPPCHRRMALDALNRLEVNR